MSIRIKPAKCWPLGLFPILLVVISLIPSAPLTYGIEEDGPETTEEFREAQEDKGVGCQPDDDYCDYDQNCEWSSIDCIDDTKFDEDDYDG